MTVGSSRAPGRAVRPGAGLRTLVLPTLVAVIHHPTQGPVLFDTGYSQRFFEATRHFPRRVHRWLMRVRCEPEETVVAQLGQMGISPGDVRNVIISHFDADHIGGLRDFPVARVICHGEAWDAVRGGGGLSGLLSDRLLPGHLPDDLEDRLHLIADFPLPTAGPLPGGHDLFGDSSVLLVPLPGHAPGHMGALVERSGGGSWLLAADAIWTRATLRLAAPTAHTLLATDRRAQRATYSLLRQLAQEAPEVTIIPTHCPEAVADVLSP